MKVTFSEGPTSKRTACVGPVGFFQGAQRARAAAATIAAAIAGQTQRFRGGGCTGIGTLALVVLGGGESRSISSRVGFRSRADCQRSSGFFSRHFRTTRSRARGTAG